MPVGGQNDVSFIHFCTIYKIYNKTVLPRDEMTRLKMELEQIHGEERHEAIQKVQEECLRDMNDLKDKFNQIEQDLRDEVNSFFK